MNNFNACQSIRENVAPRSNLYCDEAHSQTALLTTREHRSPTLTTTHRRQRDSGRIRHQTRLPSKAADSPVHLGSMPSALAISGSVNQTFCPKNVHDPPNRKDSLTIRQAKQPQIETKDNRQ